MRTFSITPDRAYIDYLKLGAGRTLHQLHSHYTSHTQSSPSIDTLKNWSRKYDWQKRIIAHNDNIRQKLEEKIASSEAERVFNLAETLSKVGGKLLDKGNEFWDQAEITSYKDAHKSMHIACEMLSMSLRLREMALTMETTLKHRCTNCLEREFDKMTQDIRQTIESYTH